LLYFIFLQEKFCLTKMLLVLHKNHYLSFNQRMDSFRPARAAMGAVHVQDCPVIHPHMVPSRYPLNLKMASSYHMHKLKNKT
jgi:hypothetical protein